MARIKRQLTELIGHTPLLELVRLQQAYHAQARILAKLEYFNPGGSLKDRVALAMIEDAERRNLLKPGGTVIEATSGNTGVGLAWVAGSKGYRVVITMPETMSCERRYLVEAMGAEIILTPGEKGMRGAIDKAEELQRSIPGSIILKQFENPANTEIHATTTAEEIWEDTDGQVDVFISGVGTGGTLSGVGKSLKRHNPHVKIIGVEPHNSAVLSGGNPGPHMLQGLGAGFIPATYHSEVIDRMTSVTDDEAIRMGRELSLREGVLAGISSGAVVHVALQLACRPEYAGKNIVVLVADTGERYLSTPLYAFKEYPL